MKYRIHVLPCIVLMLSTLSAWGQSPHYWHRHNVAIGCNHHSADSLLVSRFNIGLSGSVDSLRGVQLGLFTANVNNDM